MQNKQTTDDALDMFFQAAQKHSDASENGDYKTANLSYTKIVKAISCLKNEDSIDRLLPFLDHPSIGVRMWAATYLLSKPESRAINVLNEIIDSTASIHSLSSKTTLSEWEKGNLKL